MTTYTNHQQPHCDNWACSDLPSQHEDSQAISITEILNHGSISFGKYAAEPLAWEKWSVFSHNRCQEELEKFKAPGLVAQKKAYFEEYYRRIRALKVAQAEAQNAQNQETTSPEHYQDDPTNTTSIEDSIDDTRSKEEEQTSSVTQIQFSDTKTTYLNLSGDGIEDKSRVSEQQSFCSNSSGEVGVGNELGICQSAVELAHSSDVVNSKPNPSISSSPEITQKSCLVPDPATVNLTTNKEDQAPFSKPKGTVSSARNKTKLDSRTMKDAPKQPKKPKPSFQKKGPGYAENKYQLSKRTTPKPAGDIRPNSASSHRSVTEIHTRTSVLRSSIARDKLVPSSPTIKSVQTKVSSNPKVLPEKFTSRLPVPASNRSSVQSTPKEISFRANVRNMTVGNKSARGVDARKSLDLASCKTTQKGGQSENQGPKVMSVNLPPRNKSNQNIGPQFLQWSYDRRGKQKEGKDQTNAGHGRDPKPAIPKASTIYTTRSLRPTKITPLEPAELMHDPKAALPKASTIYKLQQRHDPKTALPKASTIYKSQQRHDPKTALPKASTVNKPRSPKPMKITSLESAELIHNPRPRTPSWR